MLSIKMLRPYYMKKDDKHVHVVFAYQYFSLLKDGKIYQFVPLEAREIKVNRHSHCIENLNDVFIFQRGREYHSLPLSELAKAQDFMEQLYDLIDHFLIKPAPEEKEVKSLINRLERDNINRLIDKALDERDKQAFETFSSLLNDYPVE